MRSTCCDASPSRKRTLLRAYSTARPADFSNAYVAADSVCSELTTRDSPPETHHPRRPAPTEAAVTINARDTNRIAQALATNFLCVIKPFAQTSWEIWV